MKERLFQKIRKKRKREDFKEFDLKKEKEEETTKPNFDDDMDVDVD